MGSLQTVDEASTVVPHHPLEVRPSGNAFTSGLDIKAAAGHFFLLPDELIVQILEWCDGTSLLNLGHTCKALYAFSRFEDLWKLLLIT